MEKTIKQKSYNGFWAELLNKSGSFDLFSQSAPGYDQALSRAKFGISGVTFKYWKKKIGGAVELVIQNNDYSLNKNLFEFLLALKKEIENEFGESLAWSGYENPKRFWIRKWFTEGGLSLPETWGPLQDEMIDAMKKFDKIFSPRIEKFRQRNGKEISQSKVPKYNNHELSEEAYLPSKDDFESAYRMLCSPGQKIDKKFILDQIEKNAINFGFNLKENWRLITEKNINIWVNDK